MLKRRNFLKNMVTVQAVILAPGLYWIPRTSEAVFPGIVARFLLGGLMRKGGSRAAASVTQRAIATRAAGNVSSSVASRSVFKNAPKTSVSAVSVKGVALSALSVSGVSVSFSPKIYAMSRDYGTDIVWARDGHRNTFQYDVENSTRSDLHGSLDLFVQDARTNQIIEQLPLGVLNVDAGKAFNYSFELERFDYDGVIRLFSESSAPELVAPPSGNIILAKSDEIFVSEK